MKSDKMTSRRIMIFLALSFLPPWALAFLYMTKYGKTMDGAYYGMMCSIAMLFPAIANILTRVITKEGFNRSKLALKIKGNVRYLFIALCFPVVCGYITALASAATFIPDCSVLAIIIKTDHLNVAATALYCAGVSVMGIIPGFGEEFGWRAYLTPKLEEKMPLPAAITVSGIIWGLWHAPLIVCGHNFGTDYSGYPYVGIVLMCVFCIFMGLFLTALVKATNSVIPAALGHIAFNNTIGTVPGIMFTYVVAEDYVPGNSLVYPAVMLCVTSVAALITSLVIMRINKKQKSNNLIDC